MEATEKVLIMTAPSFEGEVIVKFDLMGFFCGLDMSSANMSEVQHRYLIQNMPKTIDEVKAFMARTPNMKVTESHISFDDFWNRYDDKLLSNKKRAMKTWNNMSRSEQVKAYNHIGKYFAWLPQGTRKKYAETYLNAELWNN